MYNYYIACRRLRAKHFLPALRGGGEGPDAGETVHRQGYAFATALPKLLLWFWGFMSVAALSLALLRTAPGAVARLGRVL